MLILTRKLNESIQIGDTVNVKILGLKGRQVRIGISAPETVTVHREEIYEKIQANTHPHHTISGQSEFQAITGEPKWTNTTN